MNTITLINLEDAEFTAAVEPNGDVELYGGLTGDPAYSVFTNLKELKLLVKTLESLPERKS